MGDVRWGRWRGSGLEWGDGGRKSQKARKGRWVALDAAQPRERIINLHQAKAHILRML